jgi:predicted nucleotidyltransferase
MSLEKQIRSYFRNKDGVVAIYLFGSCASGKERRLSDIDIGILLDRHEGDLAKKTITDSMVELGRILRKDIHPVILNSASEELLRRIFSKGKNILINDSRKFARYKMVTFVKLADFAHYRKQMQSGLIKRVMEAGSVGRS